MSVSDAFVYLNFVFYILINVQIYLPIFGGEEILYEKYVLLNILVSFADHKILSALLCFFLVNLVFSIF